MQYILSEKEYKEFMSRVKADVHQNTLNKLQKMCTLAANHVPIYRSWDENDKSPWGCDLKNGEKSDYCDECPSSIYCPYKDKRWSK